jgi:hypothetical protein
MAATENKKQDAAGQKKVDDFRAFINTTFAARDCNMVAPLPKD